MCPTNIPVEEIGDYEVAIIGELAFFATKFPE